MSTVNGDTIETNTVPPLTLPVHLGNVPNEMQNVPRWVLWKYDRNGSGWRKVPYSAKGTPASSTNAETWTTFEKVAGLYLRGGWGGIGFVLGDGFAGVDLDDVLNDSGTMLPWAARLAAKFDTYTEVSPSGTGIKLFMRGAFDGNGIGATPHPQGGATELYHGGRFFCVTGALWEEHGKNGVEQRDAELQSLADEVRQRRKTLKSESQSPAPVTPASGVVGSTTAYGRAALEREARRVAAAGEGTRNGTLNEAAFAIGTLVGSGEVEQHEAEAALIGAGRECGLSEHETASVVRRAIHDGREQPRTKPPANGSPYKVGASFGARNEDAAADEVVPRRPLPAEMLPRGLREFVIEHAAALDVFPETLATHALPVLASLVGNKAILEVTPTWRVPCVLWGVNLAESGDRKTPGYDAALAPIWRREQELQIQNAEQRERWQQEHACWKREHRKWESGSDNGEPPAEPQQPPVRTLVCSDITMEALRGVLKDNPQGILAARDELSGFIEERERYGNGSDEAAWLSCFNAGPIKSDRASKGSTFIPHAAVSLTGTCQPAVWGKAMAGLRESSGMAGRFLVSQPARRHHSWASVTQQRDTQRASSLYDSLVGRLIDLEPNEDGTPIVVALLQDAAAVYGVWYDEHQHRKNAENGPLRWALAKLEETPLRLALVFAACRFSTPMESDNRHVTADEMQSALAVCDYYVNEAYRLYLSGSDADFAEQRALDWITAHGGEATESELAHGPREFRRMGQERRESLLACLVRKGKLNTRTEVSDAGGKPKQVYSVAPVALAPIPYANTGNTRVSVPVPAAHRQESVASELR